MSDSNLPEIVARKKDRALAIILGVKERECDKFLPPHVQQRLRKVVLDQVNEFHDLVIDIIRGLDGENAVYNEEYFARLERKLDEIYRKVS